VERPTQGELAVKKAAILALALLAAACSNNSTAPTSMGTPRTAVTAFASFGVIASQTLSSPSLRLAACLAGTGDSGCFSGASMRARTAVGGQAVLPPLNLAASSIGSNVTLTWTAAAPAVAYIIEAGSAPGLANLANFSTGNPQTAFAAAGVGAGAYYVRVRAMSSAGEVSEASNEVLLVVAGNGPCVQPAPPSGLSVVSVTLGTVILAWSPSAGNPTSYVVEAGSSPGASNLANSDLGGPAPSLTATGVGPGVYYVRVRGKNACGLGGPSNEVVVVVGNASGPRTTFGAGSYIVGRDIAAARYYGAPAAGCYWERRSGLGGTFAEILANDFIGPNQAQAIVDVLASDVGFSTNGECRTWSTQPPYGFQSSIPPGAWLVGGQVAAGIYRANANAGCYWERRRNFTGTSAAIIANDFVSSAGPQTVAIAADDVGFYADANCGVWIRIAAVTTVSTGGSPSDVHAKWNQHRARSSRLFGSD
jgi:hypothetical protein